jgi:hypothetical protein
MLWNRGDVHEVQSLSEKTEPANLGTGETQNDRDKSTPARAHSDQGYSPSVECQ